MSIVVDCYLDELDNARSNRARELSEIKRVFSLSSQSDPLGVSSKAVVVLSYAAWEGFYNECIDVYYKFLKENNIKVIDIGFKMLLGALTAEFESLRSRNHSGVSKRSFIEKLQEKMSCTFENFDLSIIRSRSNLNYDKIKENYEIMGFSLEALNPYRIKLDREIVGWRHGVAHGAPPKLMAVDTENHIELVNELLLIVSDHFQEAIIGFQRT
ncbi:Uncharacterised protein [Starkeya nomas]|uniref:MAE-28990/MAE-18760-like HEPN domain-containing protein n=1 Tax=Starkeya nomas TaxID=2666134 RepID=A0A5S9NYG9_9HYPH|nr:MAE_28990/MAE_18760 family HEPN-like nuclease [Starkeya nomas]CAA0095864.1 Uncharacterised protein [Starkeya nomas]